MIPPAEKKKSIPYSGADGLDTCGLIDLHCRKASVNLPDRACKSDNETQYTNSQTGFLRSR